MVQRFHQTMPSVAMCLLSGFGNTGCAPPNAVSIDFSLATGKILAWFLHVVLFRYPIKRLRDEVPNSV
jgi:hypothetical protein